MFQQMFFRLFKRLHFEGAGLHKGIGGYTLTAHRLIGLSREKGGERKKHLWKNFFPLGIMTNFVIHYIYFGSTFIRLIHPV